MKLDALWVGGWPYAVSVLNNRWPQIRFIVRRWRLEKEEIGGPDLAATLFIQHSYQQNKLSLTDQREKGREIKEGEGDWLKLAMLIKTLTLRLKRQSIFTWVKNNWCCFWISKLSLTARDRWREYQRDQSRPGALFSSGTISVWSLSFLSATLDVKSVISPTPPSFHQQVGLALLKVYSCWKEVFCPCGLFGGQTLRISEAPGDIFDWIIPVTVWHTYLCFLG